MAAADRWEDGELEEPGRGAGAGRGQEDRQEDRQADGQEDGLSDPPTPDDDDELGLLTLEAEAGARLDAFLVAQLESRGHSRVEIQGWIREGRVDLVRAGTHGEEPRALKRSTKLRPGDSVVVRLPPPPAPPEPLRPEAIDLTILHQDAAILVLDKPPGLTVHPGAGQRDGTLVNALLHASPGALSTVGGEERPGIVHRLDKDTSGVIVVARSDRAHRLLARQFHDRTVKKRYLALTQGEPRAEQGKVDEPIGRHPKDRKRMAVVAGGRAARTEYRVLERLSGHALVELRPETGRTHQIRVHLQHLGTPILADATYGRGRAATFEAGEAILERQALHAARLELDHPETGERMTFEAPLPPDIAAVLEALRGRSA